MIQLCPSEMANLKTALTNFVRIGMNSNIVVLDSEKTLKPPQIKMTITKLDKDTSVPAPASA